MRYRGVDVVRVHPVISHSWVTGSVPSWPQLSFGLLVLRTWVVPVDEGIGFYLFLSNATTLYLEGALALVSSVAQPTVNSTPENRREASDATSTSLYPSLVACWSHGGIPSIAFYCTRNGVFPLSILVGFWICCSFSLKQSLHAKKGRSYRRCDSILVTRHVGVFAPLKRP